MKNSSNEKVSKITAISFLIVGMIMSVYGMFDSSFTAIGGSVLVVAIIMIISLMTK